MTGRGKAYGDRLLYLPTNKYTLIINERLLDKPADFVRKIAIHEAVHLGYGSHNDDFMRVVKKYNGAVSENDVVTDGDITVWYQPAPKKRYVQVEPKSESTFKDRKKALAFRDAHFAKHQLPVRLRS